MNVNRYSNLSRQISKDLRCVRHVYWTDQNKGIFRTELDGSGVVNVVSDDVDQPDGVAVDWIAGNLFWSDTGKLGPFSVQV